MTKKRKLNSSNPKYWPEGKQRGPVVKNKVLMCEPKGVKVYAVWYENE